MCVCVCHSQTHTHTHTHTHIHTHTYTHTYTYTYTYIIHTHSMFTSQLADFNFSSDPRRPRGGATPAEGLGCRDLVAPCDASQVGGVSQRRQRISVAAMSQIPIGWLIKKEGFEETPLTTGNDRWYAIVCPSIFAKRTLLVAADAVFL